MTNKSKLKLKKLNFLSRNRVEKMEIENLVEEEEKEEE